MKLLTLTAAFSLLAAPVLAESHVSGDAEAGAAAFDKQCVTCHVVVNDEGETLAGRRAKNGPNLYGVAGRALGSFEGFRYGKSMIAAGEAGHMWSEENFVGYVQDPTGWLKETLDDKLVRGKMTFKVRKEEDAMNIYAFLASIGPAMEEMEEAEAAPASN